MHVFGGIILCEQAYCSNWGGGGGGGGGGKRIGWFECQALCAAVCRKIYNVKSVAYPPPLLLRLWIDCRGALFMCMCALYMYVVVVHCVMF